MRWFRKQRAPQVGLYGKHPTAADFVRLNAGGATLKAFDSWISEALVAANRALDDWDDAYQRATPTGFLYRGQASGAEPTCIAGALAPSRDRSGRAYPLLLFAELEENLALQAYPALPFHPFVEQSRDLLARRSELSHEELLAAAGQLKLPDEADVQTAIGARDAFLGESDGAAALREMLGPSAAVQRASLAQLRQIGQTNDDVAAVGRYGIRCPVQGQANGHTAFWLSLLRRELKLPLVPSVLCSSTNALIYLDRVASKALAACWGAPWADDSIVDLASSQPSDEAEQTPPLATGEPLAALLR